MTAILLIITAAILCGLSIITAAVIWAALRLKAQTDAIQSRAETAELSLAVIAADNRDLQDAHRRIAELEALLAAVPVDALRRTYLPDIHDDPQDTVAIETWFAQYHQAQAQPSAQAAPSITETLADLRRHFGPHFDAIDDVDAWVQSVRRDDEPADTNSSQS